jgi:hypothetical protein
MRRNLGIIMRLGKPIDYSGCFFSVSYQSTLTHLESRGTHTLLLISLVKLKKDLWPGQRVPILFWKELLFSRARCARWRWEFLSLMEGQGKYISGGTNHRYRARPSLYHNNMIVLTITSKSSSVLIRSNEISKFFFFFFFLSIIFFITRYISCIMSV